MVHMQIFLLSRSDCCDQFRNGGVQIEVWSSAVNPGRLFTNAYMNQTLKQALDSKICIEYVVSRVKTKEQTHKVVIILKAMAAFNLSTKNSNRGRELCKQNLNNTHFSQQ